MKNYSLSITVFVFLIIFLLLTLLTKWFYIAVFIIAILLISVIRFEHSIKDDKRYE